MIRQQEPAGCTYAALAVAKWLLWRQIWLSCRARALICLWRVVTFLFQNQKRGDQLICWMVVPSTKSHHILLEKVSQRGSHLQWVDNEINWQDKTAFVTNSLKTGAQVEWKQFKDFDDADQHFHIKCVVCSEIKPQLCNSVIPAPVYLHSIVHIERMMSMMKIINSNDCVAHV